MSDKLCPHVGKTVAREFNKEIDTQINQSTKETFKIIPASSRHPAGRSLSSYSDYIGASPNFRKFS